MKNHGDKLIESERDCTLVDSEDQMLDFRVGCVFYGDNEGIGLWIGYQEKYLDGKLFGPVLISENNWKQIRNHVNKRFTFFRRNKRKTK